MKVLFILGTRPEAIKLAPLIKKLQADPFFTVKLCNTEQHKEMTAQVLDLFSIRQDYSLNIMKSGQSLSLLAASMIEKLDPLLKKETPDLVVVQGDTNTVLAGSLAAFYNKIPVAHIEAGLRSYEKYAPFPEEINRGLTSRLADFHFAPTELAKQNLMKEGIEKNVFLVGNTVIDALHLTLNIIKGKDEAYRKYFQAINPEKKIILFTCHRRENFGQPFEEICEALNTLANAYPDVQIVYPVHPNPNVRDAASALLKAPNIIRIEPLDYAEMVWLMNKAYLILTDSGGLQEEAPALNKPVLVLREVTERPEGIEAGVAKLVGTNKEKIITEVNSLLKSAEAYNAMANGENPYGDGTSCEKIKEILKSGRF